MTGAAPLTGREAEQLASAQHAAARGDYGEAATILAGLITAGQRHVDVLMLYSSVCEPLGKASDALGACQAAAQAAPDRADIIANLGRLLLKQGRSTDALVELERAVALNEDVAEIWYNLGMAANMAGQPERARSALDRAVEIAPQWSMGWATRGFVAQQAGDLEAAEASLRRALALDRSLPFARHYLAATLRDAGRFDEALEWTDGAALVETQLLRAHLQADVAPLDAVETYRSVLRERPDMVDAHEALGSLLPQLGRPEEALTTYRDALARTPSLPMYLSAIATARALRDFATMRELAVEAQRSFGSSDDLAAYEGIALDGLGETEAGLAILEALVARGYSGVLGHCAYGRLKLGDLDRAEEHALAASQVMPRDQSAWAYLSIIWRLKGDPREAWLADYERLVMPVDLEAPPGFAGSTQFMAALADELHRLHTTTDHPADQSLRQGTQTRGSLFDRDLPHVRALAGQIRQQLQAPLSLLPADPTHPFLSHNSGKVRFATSWSVRLRSGGFHVHHIHQKGWLSSALYVSLPPEVGADEGSGDMAGWLAFGTPPAELGIDLEPRRVVRPQVGRLVVFPSYFWHGTIPFESAEPRLTVAFDAIPA